MAATYHFVLVQFGSTNLFPELRKEYDFTRRKLTLDDGTKISLIIHQAAKDRRTEVRGNQTILLLASEFQRLRGYIIDDEGADYLLLTDNRQAMTANSVYYDAKNVEATLQAIGQKLISRLAQSNSIAI